MADEATRLLLRSKHLLRTDSSLTKAFSCGSMSRKRKPISQEEQSRRFEEAAREAGVDTSDETLERLVRQVVKPAPKPAKSPRKK